MKDDLAAHWRIESQRLLHDCRIFRLREDTAFFSRAGANRRFYVLESPPWCNVVPLTGRGTALLVRQYRHGARALTLEFPSGLVDPGEEPAQTARRELLEETGHRAAKVRAIGIVQPNPAFQDNRCHTFLATGVKPVAEPATDAFEETEVVETPVERITPMILDGTLDHSLTVCAWFWYLAHAGQLA